MSQQRLQFDLSTVDEVFSCFADTDCRQILSVLFALENESVTVRDLATYLVPAYSDRPQDDEIKEQVATTLTTLRDTYLPELTEVGLIEREGDIVSLNGHPIFQYDLIRDILSAELDNEVAVGRSSFSSTVPG